MNCSGKKLEFGPSMGAGSLSFRRSAKELVRHSLAKCGLSWVHIMLRRACGQNLAHLQAVSLTERFQAIYRNGAWLSGDPSGSLSGLGSSLAATEAIREKLPDLLRSLGTRALLDVGCGDFLWMNEVDLPCDYIGVDIVPELISHNTERYACPGRSFLLMDATTCILPPADTVLCREMLFHLSFEDIGRVMANVERSGARFLVSTNDEGLRVNADILSGDFRLLNLKKAPFFFPEPLVAVADNRVSPNRTLSVWDASNLPIGVGKFVVS
jgi:hypothetical protein